MEPQAQKQKDTAKSTCKQACLSCLLSLVGCLVAGCALDLNDDDDSEDGSSVTVPPTGLFGIDTNQVSGYPHLDGSNLRINFAKKKNIGWVGRYIVDDRKGHEAITLSEVHRWLGRDISVAFIWEVHDQHRACTGSKLEDERVRGENDGRAAQKYMNETLHAPNAVAVYFTVDFKVTDDEWDQGAQVDDCTRGIASRDLIVEYFTGIGSTFVTNPIGVYGSHGTIKGLLEEAGLAKIQYAWQQTFRGDELVPDERVILQQWNIHPSQKGWLKHRHKLGGLDYDASQKGVTSMWTRGEK